MTCILVLVNTLRIAGKYVNLGTFLQCSSHSVEAYFITEKDTFPPVIPGLHASIQKSFLTEVECYSSFLLVRSIYVCISSFGQPNFSTYGHGPRLPPKAQQYSYRPLPQPPPVAASQQLPFPWKGPHAPR